MTLPATHADKLTVGYTARQSRAYMPRKRGQRWLPPWKLDESCYARAPALLLVPLCIQSAGLFG